MNWPNLSKFNFTLVLIFLLLFLALFFSSKWLYREFGIILPLEKKLMNIAVVNDVEISGSGNSLTIVLKLQEVEDLQDSYYEIKKVLPEDKKISLEINDERDDYLNLLWQECRFPLEEASVLNNLVANKKIVEENLRESKVERWLIGVDGENFYFQIHYQNAYLYEIIPRSHSTKEASLGGET